MKPRWISKPVALAIHDWLIAVHGGAPGVLDEGRLESALDAPRNLLGYGKPDVFDLAASYAGALTRNHPFRDGNKRMALTVAGVFLEINGFRLAAPEAEAVRATLGLATRELEEPAFAEWLRGNSVRLPGHPPARRKAIRRARPEARRPGRKRK